MQGPRLLGIDLIGLGVLAACAVFLFADLRPMPIQLWDESRIAVNAAEMHLGGASVVTTYGFQPDLWNTKPPLLVWLIAGAMAVLGPGELAVRAPSILAALATLAMVMGFTRRMAGSRGAGALAAVLLTASVGFFGEHGARTGDYDALLTAFSTAYLIVLFHALRRRRPSARLLAAAAALAACALLTKSVAGAVPAAGLALYVLAARRFGRVFSSPWYVVASLAALTPVAAFYLARESAAPGYLAATWGNDVSGRFLTALDSHAGAPWYYLYVIGAALFFSAGPLVFLAPAALPFARGKARMGLLFALCAAAGIVGVVSLSSTKLPQYVAPAYPFLAMATAIAATVVLRRLKGAPLMTARAALALAVACAVAAGGYYRYVLTPERAFRHQALYGEVFARLEAEGRRAVAVVDSGIEAVGVPPGYSPQLRFYTLVANARGLTVERASDAASAHTPVVATCDPDHLTAVAAGGAALPAPARCRVVIRR